MAGNLNGIVAFSIFPLQSSCAVAKENSENNRKDHRNRNSYHIRTLPRHPPHVREAVENVCETLAEEFQCLRYVRVHCEDRLKVIDNRISSPDRLHAW